MIRSCTLSTLLRWVALALLVTMSVVPRGVMPAWGAEGMTVVLCTGTGPVEVTLGPDGTPLSEDAWADPCVWVGVAPVALEPVAAPVVAAPFALLAAPLTIPVRAQRAKAEPGSDHNRGPPILI
ncbi:hypothetical protein [uncultured Maritimibacter sp.]|jgi:hypothetical protein|uniref:hypothetical protein n=1 Tax=uncultured Maritimibacter sp. TaxID=991866 RepID=UPI002609A8EE|nr:hypothetical protein [uncultured Maritimibacter sp.]